MRDCDVYLEHLQSVDVRPPKRVRKELHREQRAARKEFKARRRRLRQDERFEKKVKALLAKVAWPKRHSSRDAPPYSVWYRNQFSPLAARFLVSGSADLRDNAKLHEFRIATKRLRYALELAGPAIPPRKQRRLYDALSDLQDRLGDVCDRVAATERLLGWLDKADKSKDRRELSDLLNREERALVASRKGFFRSWSSARQKELKAQLRTATGERGPSE